MAFNRVNSVSVRLDRIPAFQEQVGELAAAARAKKESWRWTAHQMVFGEGSRIHFVSAAENFEEIERQGEVLDLWLRAMGEDKGSESFDRTNECIQAVQQTLSIDRPDLSYAHDVGKPTDYPYAVVTEVRARPGQAESCEELIRKIAEAIPKVGDPARMMSRQVMVGELGVYWTIRPLRHLADLDRQLPTPDLLVKAFGAAEGGLLWRSGAESTERVRREIVRYVPELSNPPRT